MSRRIITPDEAAAIAEKKMSNGTLGGRSLVAQPVVPRFVPRVLPGGGSDCVQELLVESFTAADGDFATASLDLTWVSSSGLVIAGNQVRGINDSGLGRAGLDHAFPTDDMRVAVTVTAWTLCDLDPDDWLFGNLIELYARYATNDPDFATQSGLTLRVETVGGSPSVATWAIVWSLADLSSGTVATGTSANPAPGDVISFTVHGSLLQGYLNNSLILSGIDSNVTVGRYGGFELFGCSRSGEPTDGAVGVGGGSQPTTNADLAIDDFVIYNLC